MSGGEHLTVLDFTRAEDALSWEAKNREELGAGVKYALETMGDGLRRPGTISNSARERSVQALQEWAMSLLAVAHALEQGEIP